MCKLQYVQSTAIASSNILPANSVTTMSSSGQAYIKSAKIVGSLIIMQTLTYCRDFWLLIMFYSGIAHKRRAGQWDQFSPHSNVCLNHSDNLIYSWHNVIRVWGPFLPTSLAKTVGLSSANHRYAKLPNYSQQLFASLYAFKQLFKFSWICWQLI